MIRTAVPTIFNISNPPKRIDTGRRVLTRNSPADVPVGVVARSEHNFSLSFMQGKKLIYFIQESLKSTPTLLLKPILSILIQTMNLTATYTTNLKAVKNVTLLFSKTVD